MHTLLALLAVLAVLAVLVALFAFTSWIASRPRGHQLHPLANTEPVNWGTFEGGLRTFLADGAITTRYLLVKKGSDASHIAAITATADEPIGVLVDEPSAAEQPAAVELFGAHERTVPVVSGGAITDGANLYAKSDGTVTVKPTSAGTYWQVGSAIGAWATGEPFTMIARKPRKLIVVAALTQTSSTTIAAVHSTAVNPTKSDFDALLAEAGKLQADFYVLSAALTGDADVTVATT